MQRNLKKLFCLILCAVLVLTLPLFAFANSLGDVDGDGEVTAADARLALRISVKLEPNITPETAVFRAADVNEDGSVGSDDARTILRVAVKLEGFGQGDPAGAFSGVWCNYNELVSVEEYYPKLALYPDGTFLFRVNLYEAMSDVKGTYQLRDGRIYCTVKELGFGGFAGDNVSELIFSIGQSALIYEGDPVGMTIAGDAFYSYNGVITPLA